MPDRNGQSLDPTGPAASLSEGVLSADLEGRVLGMDRRFAELWQLEGCPVCLDLDQFARHVQQVARDPEEVREHFFPAGRPPAPDESEIFGNFVLKDGRTLEMKVRACGHHHRKTGSIWSVRDISQGAKIGQRVLQAQKMAAIGRLVGGISHDFNNLLTVIRGYCDLSLARLDASRPPIHRLRDSVGEISKAAERASELTGQLLAYSRQQMVTPKMLDVNAELRDLEKMLVRLVGGTVQLRLELLAQPATIEADRGQLQQMVMNLVINARDAMPEGGQLTLRTESLTIDEPFARRFDYPVELGPKVMLCVRDTGVGIAPEHVDRIFEPFFTTKEVGHGTGLGLATVYGIAKQSGGYIWVKSELGTGTEFRVCLPQVIGDVAIEAVELRPKVAPPKGESILVVEAEEQVREVIIQLLADAGYGVHGVAFPREALTLQDRGKRFDLLITDLNMPEMAGDQLAREMAERQNDLAVLYTSGFHPEAYERRGVLPEDATVLAKPLDAGALRRKVSEVLG